MELRVQRREHRRMEHTARNVAALRNAYGDFAHGIYLGQGPNGCVYAGAERSTMVLGPSAQERHHPWSYPIFCSPTVPW